MIPSLYPTSMVPSFCIFNPATNQGEDTGHQRIRIRDEGEEVFALRKQQRFSIISWMPTNDR